MISLSNAIEALRSELARSIEMGKKEDIQFELGGVSIQLEVVAEETTAADGKVNWWVFSGGIQNQVGDKSRHLLTVNLQPTDSQGLPLKVRSHREKAAK